MAHHHSSVSEAVINAVLEILPSLTPADLADPGVSWKQLQADSVDQVEIYQSAVNRLGLSPAPRPTKTATVSELTALLAAERAAP
ncbi:hypothetical protein [Streptomyces goshikiensis]|uniref:hypothetical protein n=1 Tax=Streptomyces goshikiensis TaxID=1942 RepID=UPI0036C11327